MANTKIPVELSSTPGIVDNSNATAITIDSSENVGIGTTSPNKLLHLKANTPVINLHSDNASSAQISFTNSGGVSEQGFIKYEHDGDFSGNMQFRVAGSERVRIDTSGNVGIGTTSVDVKLHIGDTSASTLLKLERLSVGGTMGIDFNAGNNGSIFNNIQYGRIDVQSTATGGSAESGVMTFHTRNSGTTAERMRIDSSGNVGIGTTSPTYPLVVSRSGTGIKAFFTNTTDADFGINLSSGLTLLTPTTGTLAFGTSSTERMRISSAGDVIVGGTSPYSVTKMTVDFPSESRFGVTLRDTGSAGTTRMMNFVKSGSVVGSIDSTTTATAYNTSSDYRLKENVEYDWDATTRLKQLRPSRFNFIADADTTVDGFLAHEVQDIVPEAITGVKDEMQEEEYEVTPAVLDEDGNVVTEAVMGTREVPKYQGIDQSKLVPLLVKTIQELEARITALES